jgi:hypothetical protein
LTRLHNFSGSGQLKQHCIGVCLIAGPVSANAKLEIRLFEYLLRFESILANDVRDLRFRTSERQVNGRRYSEEKDNNDRNHDRDAAEYRYDSGR